MSPRLAAKSGAEEAADKTLCWIGETTGRIRTLEAERRTARRMGERGTYVVSARADEGWKVQTEGASRATSVLNKRRGDAVAGGRELAGSRQPSHLLVRKQDGVVRKAHTRG